MKAFALLLGLGVLAPMLQSVAAAYVPARYVPDLSLLVVVGIGLHWRGAAGGLVLAALAGFAADLLSGALLGQHALLRMLAFGAARLGARSLDLRGVLPQAGFAAGLTAANAVALVALTAFFTGASDLPLLVRGDLAAQAAANAVCAAPVAGAIGWWIRLVSEGDRRVVRLDPRGRAA